MIERRKGLIAATFTPMDPDGQVAPQRVEAYAAHLDRLGVRAVFVNGSSGEGPSLTADERQLMASRWCDVAGTSMDVIVHVGSCCVPEAQALARHAAASGASAIATVPPFYFRPGSANDLTAYLSELASAAPDLPLYYYHIPRMTGVELAVSRWLVPVAEAVPSLAGVKFSHADLEDFAACVAVAGKRFDMCFGLDEMLLSALAVGGMRAIGTTYNFAAPLYRRMIEQFRAGQHDQARQEQVRAVELIRTLQGYGFYAAAKATMRMIGLDVGPVRSPLPALSDAQCEQLHGELEGIGFFQWGVSPSQAAALSLPRPKT